MALATTMINRAPVSTEELLSKSSKKASLAPEDDTVFVEKNTSQLGYERVWENRAQFNIESNGEMNTLELQHDSYGMRADTAFFVLVFKITLYGDDKDCSCPANIFPFVAFNTFRMRIGQNQAEVIAPTEHYIHKFINILNSNFSKQDKLNVLSLFGCFPEFDLNQPKYRLMLARQYGFVFKANDKQTAHVVNVPFIVPLTIVHRMFNHKTILPVGTRISFEFTVNPDGNKNAIIQPDGYTKGTYEFLPRESFLYAQYPERDPAIMLAQLENRQYVSEGLDYEPYRIDIQKGVSYVSIPILRPGSKLPAKIDMALIPTSVLNANKDIFQMKGMGVSAIEIIYNGPFPNNFRYVTFSGKGNEAWSDDSNVGSLDKFLFFYEFFNQTDTFLLDKFGESYNNETTYPPIKRIHPYMGYVSENSVMKFDDNMYASLRGLHDNRQLYTCILLPSKMMDGSAYPTVEGSLDINLFFDSKLDENVTMYVNCNYFQQLLLNENYQCDIRNITLDNFTGKKPFDDPTMLPPSTNVSESMPVGEASNIQS